VSDEDIKRLYYSIGEVGRMLDIDQHVLRYWETEFRELAPRKNRTGKRQYRDSDIETLKRIKHLLYEERYTIEGARRQLKLKSRGRVSLSTDSLSDSSDRALKSIQDVRKGLQELKDIIGT